jgi:Cdc6-like AAA superfamily ATPase
VQWTLRPDFYLPWKDFQLEVKHSLLFETGSCYHLAGNNGTGKTSFIRKVLIPYLQRQPYSQYVLYIEQQVQSQFDAVKSNAALGKPPLHIESLQDMIAYLIAITNRHLIANPRPLIIILDELHQLENVLNWLSKKQLHDVCLLFVSHVDIEINLNLNKYHLDFNLVKPNHTIVERHENDL